MVELWQGDVDCVVFLQTIEHIQDPDAMLGPRPTPDRARRRRLRLHAERAHARAEGRRALRQPVARARVQAGRVPRAVRAPLRPRRPARALPRPQAARARAGAAGWAGIACTRRCASRSRSTTASHPRSRPVISCCGARTSTARSTCWRCCAREAAEHRPAHAHALRRGLRDVAVRRGVAVGGDRHQLPAAARRARHATRARSRSRSRRCWPTSSRRRARSSAA